MPAAVILTANRSYFVSHLPFSYSTHVVPRFSLFIRFSFCEKGEIRGAEGPVVAVCDLPHAKGGFDFILGFYSCQAQDARSCKA